MASGASQKIQAQRLPAPSLFVGPPSRNASNASLLGPTSSIPSSRAPLAKQRSLLEDPRHAEHDHNNNNNNNNNNDSSVGSPSDPLSRREQDRRKAEQQSNDRTDAIWAEMQNTLEEVELSALNGNPIFSPNHAQALDELRAAQIALAQAWVRGETEDEDRRQGEEDDDEGGAGKKGPEQDSRSNTAAHLASDRADKLGGSESVGGGGAAAASRARSGSTRSTASGTVQLEEDTEKDIRLARKRRELNDRYFHKVNAGVLDVVAKLEEVARAMKAVEQESKEIWTDNDSVETSSSPNAS